MTLDEIENNFTYRAPCAGEVDLCQEIVEKAKDLAHLFFSHCKPSREASLAFTKLEEAVMWANASIARHG